MEVEAKATSQDPVLAYLLEEQQTHEEMWNRPSERIREVIDRYAAMQVEREIDEAAQRVVDAAVDWAVDILEHNGQLRRKPAYALYEAVVQYNLSLT